jgi:hypothetical protein
MKKSKKELSEFSLTEFPKNKFSTGDTVLVTCQPVMAMIVTENHPMYEFHAFNEWNFLAWITDEYLVTSKIVLTEKVIKLKEF